MPITASLGALTSLKTNQIYFPGSRYYPTTTGPGTPYGMDTTATNPYPNLINITNSNGYTIEYWCRYTNLTTGGTPIAFGNFKSGFTAYWFIQTLGTGFIRVNTGAGDINTQSAQITSSTWINMALVFTPSGSDTIIQLYKNGTAVNIRLGTSGGYSTSVTVTTSLLTYSSYTEFTIAPYNQTPSQTGYFDEVRVSSIARYASNYSVATQPFTSDAYTELLLHFVYDVSYGASTPIIDSGPNNITMINRGGVTGTLANNQIFKF